MRLCGFSLLAWDAGIWAVCVLMTQDMYIVNLCVECVSLGVWESKHVYL